MEILKTYFDTRSECLSILTCMTLEEYKSIVYKPFSRGGNLDGQRDVIKRSSVASKIRKRMHEDFIAGAIFPQVVIGVLLPSEQFQEIKNARESFAPDQYGEDAFSIIDGMQRSNIYFSNYDGNEQREIRVEFWISDKTIKLLYRMLVLNTGQVPWNTRRQIEVIFSGLSRSIIERALEKNPELEGKIEIIGVDDAKRRTQAGKYHKSTMIELYLGFNTRKVKVDVSDELADEFQRFDMMESIEKDILQLYQCIEYLFRLNNCFTLSAVHGIDLSKSIDIVLAHEFKISESDNLYRVIKENAAQATIDNFLKILPGTPEANSDTYNMVSSYIYRLRCSIAHLRYEQDDISNVDWENCITALIEILCSIYQKCDKDIVEVCKSKRSWTEISI